MSWLGEWGWNRRTRWWRTGRARRSGDPEQVRDCSSKRWWCETSSPTPASSESGLSTRLGFFPPVWMQRKIEWKVFDKKKFKISLNFEIFLACFVCLGQSELFSSGWTEWEWEKQCDWCNAVCIRKASKAGDTFFFLLWIWVFWVLLFISENYVNFWL